MKYLILSQKIENLYQLSQQIGEIKTQNLDIKNRKNIVTEN
jgi:hypothetical protein